MAADTASTPWVTCASPGCGGAQVDATGRCLRHITDEELQGWLGRLGGDDVLDARGVTLGKDLLAAVLDGRTTLPSVRFDRATFERDASFDKLVFEGDASFDGATFERKAGFGGVRFTQGARFNGTRFAGHAWFVGTTFDGAAVFDGAVFSGPAWYTQAVFTHGAGFRDCRFEGLVDLSKSSTHGELDLDGAFLARELGVDGATFASPPSVDGTALRSGRPLPVYDATLKVLTWPDPRSRATRAQGTAKRIIRRIWIPALVLIFIGIMAFLLRTDSTGSNEPGPGRSESPPNGG